MLSEKNKFVRFAKIPIPPVITMAGKMVNHKFALKHQETEKEEVRAPWGQPDGCRDEDEAEMDKYDGYDDIMAKLQMKFARYEEEDKQTGTVRSFLYKEGDVRRKPLGPPMFTMEKTQKPENEEDMDAADLEEHSGFDSAMARLQEKFARYEEEDRKAGAVRSFIHKEGEQKEDTAYQTAGACSGFGFRKGDSFYVNESLRCGNREKQSRASILVYLALHFCDLDSRGFCPYGNTREIAKMTGLTVRTVRNSLWKLAEAGYIQAGGIDRDGDFTFHVPDYENIGLTYLEGGRGYTNIEEGMLRQLASMRDVNALRMALRMLITVDNPRSSGEAVVREKSLRSSLPGYVTREKFQEAVGRIREACSFLHVGESRGRNCFIVSLPKEQDAKVRREESDLENLKKLDEYIPQLSSLYGKTYDEAEEFHHKYGKYPVQFNVLGHEKEHLDRELIFKADREDAVQYASMATQYGLGIVKQALSYLANEVSVFRKWIDCKPAYLRQMIRRHPDGAFSSRGVC